jgi:hypothetical protein
MFTKENYITSHFLNNERTTIEVIYKEKEKAISYILECDPTNEICKSLFNIVSLEEIHNNTGVKLKQEKKDFESLAIRIAKKSGLLKSKTNTITKEIEVEVEKPISELLDTIFVDTIKADDENYKEEIFKTKLKAFEYDFIKSSKNRDLKAKLRKAETYLDIIRIVCEFLNEK